jgi:hypothetical protein
MASKLGHNAFTVQESVNMDVFSEWYYEVLDLSGTDTSTYATTSRPAKKVVFYVVPGAATTLEAGDVLSITLNGKTGDQIIKIDSGDLPFTITGCLITSISVANSSASASDTVSLLTFH